jgi:hypothetical protein
LWPLIPLAVVGFWPEVARIGQLQEQPEAKKKVARRG